MRIRPPMIRANLAGGPACWLAHDFPRFDYYSLKPCGVGDTCYPLIHRRIRIDPQFLPSTEARAAAARLSKGLQEFSTTKKQRFPAGNYLTNGSIREQAASAMPLRAKGKKLVIGIDSPVIDWDQL